MCRPGDTPPSELSLTTNPPLIGAGFLHKTYLVDIDLDTFKDALVDTFDSMYREILPWMDELLVRPTEAIRYCVAVRDRLRNLDIPEDVIQ